MGSSKRLRRQRWVKVFNLLIDNSRGYCLGDLFEEYEDRCKRQGKLRAIAWLCREVVLSRSYLISYAHLLGRLNGSWSKVAVAIRSLRVKATKLMLRPQIGMASVAFSVLFALFVFLSLTQRKNNDLATLHIALSAPMRMDRSTGDSIPRISINSTISVVQFDLGLPFPDADLLYEVTLSNLDGELLVFKGVRAVDNKLSILIPARFIQTGDYVLNASPGLNSRGYSYFFRVTSATGTPTEGFAK